MANNAMEQGSTVDRHPTSGAIAAGGSDGRDGGPRSKVPPLAPASAQYDDVESAAAKLGLGAAALRARCRRAAQQVGDSVMATLGGGIVAFKFGRTWRFSFPSRG